MLLVAVTHFLMKKLDRISLTCTFSLTISRSLFLVLILLAVIPFMAFGQKGGKDPKKKSNKITICHDGKNKKIKENDLQKHLDHGDLVGPCFKKVTVCHDGKRDRFFFGGSINNQLRLLQV